MDTEQHSKPHTRRHRSILIVGLLIATILALFLVFDVKDLCAHNPHDPINALALSPTYTDNGDTGDQTLFIINSGQLFRSRDGGASWQRLVHGLDNKHILSSVVVGPVDAGSEAARQRTVFVSSDRNGIYRSLDDGDSWIQVNTGLEDLEIGPLALNIRSQGDINGTGQIDTSTSIVLAAASKGGLYRTETGDEHWQRVLDKSVQITTIVFAPEPSREQQPSVLAGDSQGVLYLSLDHGQTWRQIWSVPQTHSSRGQRPGAITAIAFSPAFAVDGTLFVGTHRGGIYKSVDSGASFSEVNVGLPFTWREKVATFRASASGPMLRKTELDVLSIALSPDYVKDRTVFASLWNQAVFKSEDGGETWRRYPLGLTCSYQADMDEHRSPHFRDIQISNRFAEDKTLFLGGFDGLFKSTDGGHHWKELSTLPSYTTGLAVYPKSQGILALSTAGDGTYVTEDGGLTWTIGNVGLASADVSNITFAPSTCAAGSPAAGSDNADICLFATSVIGYLYNTDNNQENYRWDRTLLVNERKTPLLDAALKVLRIPKWFSAHVFGTSAERKASSYTAAVSPAFAIDQTVFVGTRYHGLLRSVDGGKTFEAVWMPRGVDDEPASIMDLAVSPDFAEDKTVFAGIRGTGVWKSTDGGETWRAANEGLWFVDAWASTSMVHALAEQDVKIELSPQYAADQTAFVASSVGIWKTTSGGESWQKAGVSTLDSSPYVIEVALSPNYAADIDTGGDQTLMISIKGKGLFKSQDGGDTFKPANADPIANNHMMTLIGFSPQYTLDRTVYAASPERLFVSTDGGDSWQEIYTPTRHEDDKQVIEYEGQWTRLRDEAYSAGTIRYTYPAEAIAAADAPDTAKGPRASLDFVGTGVSWICTRASDQGVARVYIDGEYMGDVDQYSGSQEYEVECFSIADLAPGHHTIVIEATGSRNPESTGSRIVLDAFDTMP